jgi:hypothetical protein
MARSRPYKKDLTALTKGGSIRTHVGKGASEQRRGPGGSETLTGGDPMQGMANQYPKPTPQPEPEAPDPDASPVPMGQSPPRQPTAMMPPSGGGDDDEAA